jgi:hypothetical protein
LQGVATGDGAPPSTYGDADSYTLVANCIAFTLVYTGGQNRALFTPREAENPLGASANAVFASFGKMGKALFYWFLILLTRF